MAVAVILTNILVAQLNHSYEVVQEESKIANSAQFLHSIALVEWQMRFRLWVRIPVRQTCHFVLTLQRLHNFVCVCARVVCDVSACVRCCGVLSVCAVCIWCDVRVVCGLMLFLFVLILFAFQRPRLKYYQAKETKTYQEITGKCPKWTPKV